MITLTLDLEDHLGIYAPDGRWVRNTRRILEFCAAIRIRGTFFAVGRVAEAAPQLLREIVGQGHELALHSYDHLALDKEDPGAYGAKLRAAKQRFEDITGKQVGGYRAPVFSLTPQAAWVLDILAGLGFVYSSSVIPGQGAFAGYPGAPSVPFKWPQGVIELPVPALRAGNFALPYLGGIYLRYLPLGLANLMKARAPRNAILWTYLHPYDIDEAEGYVRLTDGTPLWANWLLMHNRSGFLKKLAVLLDGQAAPPLIERLRDPEFTKNLPVFRD